mgnify:CR=1 FL=1
MTDYAAISFSTDIAGKLKNRDISILRGRSTLRRLRRDNVSYLYRCIVEVREESMRMNGRSHVRKEFKLS